MSNPGTPGNRRATTIERLIAVGVAGAALAPIVVASVLSPSADGHGTHQQLGLAPCGWLLAFGKPCPTCGMTTAFAHAVRGDLLHAARAQPAGMLLAVLCTVCVWIGLWTALTGSRIGPMAYAALRPLHLWVGFAAAMAAWAYVWLTWHA